MIVNVFCVSHAMFPGKCIFLSLGDTIIEQYSENSSVVCLLPQNF